MPGKKANWLRPEERKERKEELGSAKGRRLRKGCWAAVAAEIEEMAREERASAKTGCARRRPEEEVAESVLLVVLAVQEEEERGDDGLLAWLVEEKGWLVAGRGSRWPKGAGRGAGRRPKEGEGEER